MTFGDLIKPICFHLPQFHSFKENDLWWGPGFTEWTNVKRVTQTYVDGQTIIHPHRDIGYYNLLDYSARKKQADLARSYGIFGFCYHHYWFNGKVIMDTPLELMLRDGEPNLPFCLNWANEPWTRTWDGLETDVLLAQEYGLESDWIAHFNFLKKFFHHPNYIRINGQPVFVIYRIGQIPHYEQMIQCWKKLAEQEGLGGLHVVMILNCFKDGQYNPEFGEVVDGVVQYEPNNSVTFSSDYPPTLVNSTRTYDLPDCWHRVEKYPRVHPVQYRGTFPCWDNAPRRLDKAYTFINGSVRDFESHLRKMFNNVKNDPNHGDNFFFLNAWNEWAEGCVFEPSEEFGYDYLEAVQRVLKEPL